MMKYLVQDTQLSNLIISYFRKPTEGEGDIHILFIVSAFVGIQLKFVKMEEYVTEKGYVF